MWTCSHSRNTAHINAIANGWADNDCYTVYVNSHPGVSRNCDARAHAKAGREVQIKYSGGSESEQRGRAVIQWRRKYSERRDVVMTVSVRCGLWTLGGEHTPRCVAKFQNDNSTHGS